MSKKPKYLKIEIHPLNHNSLCGYLVVGDIPESKEWGRQLFLERPESGALQRPRKQKKIIAPATITS